MELQEIIVYLILAIAAGAIVRYTYRQVTGKNRSCNCGSCPHSCPRTGSTECHCHDASTASKEV